MLGIPGNPPNNPVRGEKMEVKQFQNLLTVPQPGAGGGRGEPGLSAPWIEALCH